MLRKLTKFEVQIAANTTQRTVIIDPATLNLYQLNNIVIGKSQQCKKYKCAQQNYADSTKTKHSD